MFYYIAYIGLHHYKVKYPAAFVISTVQICSTIKQCPGFRHYMFGRALCFK